MNPWTQETQNQNQSSTTLQDRRRHERTAPSQDGTHIWISDDRRICVEVIDESQTGIGVIIPDMSFSIGPRVSIDYNGQCRTATVAYLDRRDDGQYRLGLEWVEVRDA